jgi:hypothetical protein
MFWFFGEELFGVRTALIARLGPAFLRESDLQSLNAYLGSFA